MEKTIAITLTDSHLGALTTALELLARCGMGQFGQLADAVDNIKGDDTGSTIWERREAVEAACRSILTPELFSRGYYAMHNDKVPKRCQRAWELYDAIRFARGDGGVWSREPMPITGEPMPKCVFLQKKDGE